MTYRILTARQAVELRVQRILTLEQRRFSLGLEVEEIGGLTDELSREIDDIDRRIAMHAEVVWPPANGDDGDDGDDGDSGDECAPAGGDAHEVDELGARRGEHADGPLPGDVDADPRAPLPPVLGHEEDDLPGPPAEPLSLVDAANPDEPLGHVERDVTPPADPDETEIDNGETGEHASGFEGTEDGEPGRHHQLTQPEYAREHRGPFERVGAFEV